MVKRILDWLLVCSVCLLYACSGSTPNNANNGPGGITNASKQTPSAQPVTTAALPLSAYKVEWVSHQIPSEMQAGKDYGVAATLKNSGEQAWPSKGIGDQLANQVSVAYHWLSGQGDKVVVFDGERTPLPHDVAAGDTVTVNSIRVVAPNAPGSYRLQLTLVHEMVAWFEQQGANTVTVPITVK